MHRERKSPPVLSLNTRPIITAPASASIRSASRCPPSRADADTVAAHDLVSKPLPLGALDRRIAIVGTSGRAKPTPQRNSSSDCSTAAPACRSSIRSASGGACAPAPTAPHPAYPVIVFGGQHADVPITAEMGAALGHIVAVKPLVSIIDLSNSAAMPRAGVSWPHFPSSLRNQGGASSSVLDEADLWAPQRPIKGWKPAWPYRRDRAARPRARFYPMADHPTTGRRTQRRSLQADILIVMKLTSSQDRDAIGGWIEGQADRQEGKRILADLPQLQTAKVMYGPRATAFSNVSLSLSSAPLTAHAPAARRTNRHPAHPRRSRSDCDYRRTRRPDSHHPEKPNTLPDRRRRPPISSAKSRPRKSVSRPRTGKPRTQITPCRHRIARRRRAINHHPIINRRHTNTRRSSSLNRDATACCNHSCNRTIRTGITPSRAQTACRRRSARTSPIHLESARNTGRLHTQRRPFQCRAQGSARLRLYRRGERAGDADAEGIKTAGEVPPAPTTPAERLALWCGRLPRPPPKCCEPSPLRASVHRRQSTGGRPSAKSRPAAIGIPGSRCCATTV